MAIERTLHVIAWASWLAAIVVVLSVTRNPVYVGLTLLWIGLTWLVTGREAAVTVLPAAPVSPVRFGLVVIVLSTLFNALTVHAGRTVLFTIPGRIPLLSGTVTVEAALYGFLNGLVISGLFAAFMLMNRAVAVRDLIRLIPRAFYPVAVVISIAVTFVPTTLREFHQIREAQAVRGHRMRGLRSWLPLFLPLLTGGMERSLQLAEAMTARGFAGTTAPPHETALRAGMLGGLLLVTGGLLLRLVWQMPLLGALVLLGGVGLMSVTLWRAGRRHPHTVYRKRPLRRRDCLVVIMALFTALLFLVPLPGVARTSLYYTPYPEVTWPALSLILGAATWGLLGPALVLGLQQLQEQVTRAPSGAANPSTTGASTTSGSTVQPQS